MEFGFVPAGAANSAAATANTLENPGVLAVPGAVLAVPRDTGRGCAGQSRRSDFTPASSRSTSSSVVYGAMPARTAPASPSPSRREHSSA